MNETNLFLFSIFGALGFTIKGYNCALDCAGVSSVAYGLLVREV